MAPAPCTDGPDSGPRVQDADPRRRDGARARRGLWLAPCREPTSGNRRCNLPGGLVHVYMGVEAVMSEF